MMKMLLNPGQWLSAMLFVIVFMLTFLFCTIFGLHTTGSLLISLIVMLALMTFYSIWLYAGPEIE